MLETESHSSPHHDEPPFGQYQLIEKIAQGGMAEIYKGKALDASGLERSIVIKRILPHIAASSEFVDMLVDEAKIAVMLNHGNIAQVYDLGKVADDYFIVMEYVDGKTLSQIMKRLRSDGKLIPVAYAISIVMEIANALEYMHQKTDEEGNPLHIIHRDISPQNVILSTSGTVKIIDFGIAKAKTKVSTTDSGILKGKFAYMSPEHAEGMKLDHRTDIFSLGVILFELLTGQRLFKGKNNFDTVRRVKKAKVPTPSDLRPSISKELNKIIFKSLARDRNKRYQSAGDLSQDLQKFLITHYSQFTPRELIPYLSNLFPEIHPSDSRGLEITPLAPHERESPEDQRDAENSDDTVAADSEMIRQKHREAEIFAVEGTERTPVSQSESQMTASSNVEEGTSQVARAFFRTKWLFFGVPGLLFLVLLIWGVVHFRSKKQAEVSKPPTREEVLMALAKKHQRMAKSKLVKPETQKSIPKPAPASPLFTQKLPRSLMIDSEPAGAKIFLNDADTGFKTPHVFDPIPKGPLKAGLYLDKFKFWEQTIPIEKDEPHTLKIALTPNYGELQVNSSPEGAEVWINGALAGKTPFRLSQLTPDTLYEITLKLEGYVPWSQSAKIFGGRNEVFNATLKKKDKETPLPE